MKSIHLSLKQTTFPAKTTNIISRNHKKPPSINDASPSQSPIEKFFISLIHNSKSTQKLHQIHAQIIRQNLSSNSILTTQLISSSCLRNSVDYALSIFTHFDPKNSYVFNALIRGLADNSRFKSSILHFVLMLRLNVTPDRLTFPFVLKSAAGLRLGWLGRGLHGGIVKCGVDIDSFVSISLVDMYVKAGKLSFASKVFVESPDRNERKSTILWNVLINGYCKVRNLRKAMELFEQMPERNSGSWSSLINGLLMNGDLDRARELFDRMPIKDVIAWTTMISGFFQNGEHEIALSMFFRMLEEGVRPNDFTVVSALSASAKIGAFEAGVRIHDYLWANNIQLNREIGTALVEMYAKCGNIESASQSFDEMKDKDLFTWSVMIWGWAIHGHSEQAIQCFKQMMFSGIKPDGVVFLALLTACSHSVKVNLGLNFFESMRLDYSIEPSMKHYAMIVNLLGRAGQLRKALKFIEEMPIPPDFVIWEALFCACRAHKKMKMTKLISKRLLQLEPTHPGSYVFLSNVYAAVRRSKDVERVRTLMRDRGVKQDPGRSYIEVDGQVHRFVAGGHAHKCIKNIYMKLEELTSGAREHGYMPETECVRNIVEENEDAMGSHSEKLALAFAFISTPPRMTIRIVKNLRICADCHSLMKYASKISEREIALRDIKRFHHFKDGACSCGDYW